MMKRRTKIALGFVLLTQLALLALFVLADVGTSANKKKLIGVWTLISGGFGRGGETLEFSADRKMKMSAKWGGKTFRYEGTYKVKSDRIEMIIENSGQGEVDNSPQQVVTIKSLSARELIVADEEGRKRAYTKNGS